MYLIYFLTIKAASLPTFLDNTRFWEDNSLEYCGLQVDLCILNVCNAVLGKWFLASCVTRVLRIENCIFRTLYNINCFEITKCKMALGNVVYVWFFCLFVCFLNHVSDRLVGWGINFNSGIFSRKQKLLWYFFYLCEVQRMHTLLVSPWSTWSWQPGMTLDSKSRA